MNSNKHWTRLTIANSELGEVTKTVNEAELTLGEVLDQLVIPVLSAYGYGGVELWIRDSPEEE